MRNSANSQASRGRDRAKLLVMLALSGVLAFMGYKQFGSTPRPAVAAAVSKNPSGEAAPLAQAGGATHANAPAQVVEINWPRQVRRDLFRYDPTTYARVAVTDPSNNGSPTTPPTIPQVVVVTPVPRNPGTPTSPEAAARTAATGLRVQSIVMGETPRAIINGQILRAGETINGLTIKKIDSNRVTLELNGVQVFLRL